MTEFGTVLLAIAAMSLTVTKVVDFFRNVFDRSGALKGSWVWNAVALGVGLAFALGWQLNVAEALVGLVPALASHTGMVSGVSGQVLTGFVVGLGAGFWHELLDALSSIANRNNAAVPTAVSQ
jgi:hypothetical protein